MGIYFFLHVNKVINSNDGIENEEYDTLNSWRPNFHGEKVHNGNRLDHPPQDSWDYRPDRIIGLCRDGHIGNMNYTPNRCLRVVESVPAYFILSERKKIFFISQVWDITFFFYRVKANDLGYKQKARLTQKVRIKYQNLTEDPASYEIVCMAIKMITASKWVAVSKNVKISI